MMVKDDINLIYSTITVYKVNVLMLLLMYINTENKGKQNWLLGFLEFWAIEMRLYDNIVKLEIRKSCSLLLHLL